MDWAKTTAWPDEKHLSFGIWGDLYQRFYGRGCCNTRYPSETNDTAVFSVSLETIGRRHYSDVIMGPMVSPITCLTLVYSTVYSGADQRKHQSSTSLALVLGIHRWPVNSPHKGPVTRKMFPFDDIIMAIYFIGKQDFAGFESKMSFGAMSYIATAQPTRNVVSCSLTPCGASALDLGTQYSLSHQICTQCSIAH